MDWNVDLDRVIEAGLESASRLVCCLPSAARRCISLVLFELLSVELLMLARDVHPQAPFSTYRARAIDLKSYTVRWDCWRAEVDVWRISRQIRRAIVFERQEVDGVVVDLLWRHFDVG